MKGGEKEFTQKLLGNFPTNNTIVMISYTVMGFVQVFSEQLLSPLSFLQRHIGGLGE